MTKPPAFWLAVQLLPALCLLSCFTAFAQRDTLPNTFSILYEHTHFDKQFSNDWKIASLEYKRHTGFGTLVGRVNYANRFAKSGWQAEVESYPVISKKFYAYAGVSYANDVPVFPKWRTGSTLYYTFVKSWEAEGGFRYLYFDRSIWMGTASISKYAGAWLLNARFFFSVRAPFENQSFFLKAQRYLKNEQDYVWLQVGSGVSPDEARSIQLNMAAKLVSKRINAGAKLSLNKSMQLMLSAGYARDEYRIKTFGSQYNGSAGLSLKF
jgi:YaiO family outer membrane protein